MWELWRQDDHGNRYLIRTFDDRAGAESARDEFIARGHHQHYWVEAAPLVVVDGNNVMGSRPDGWWKDRAGAARRLVAQLGEWAAREEREVLVIFDGAEPDDLQRPDRVEVRFARRRGRDAADDDIAAFVAEHGGPVRVVTSDRELARRVRERGAEVVGARELLDQL